MHMRPNESSGLVRPNQLGPVRVRDEMKALLNSYPVFPFQQKGNPKVKIIIPNPPLIPLISCIKLLLIAAD